MQIEREVYSKHAFRPHADAESELMPIIAPEGRFFYLVTPHPNAHKKEKRYLYDMQPRALGIAPKIHVTHSRESAKRFTNLRLAEAFAAFLANPMFSHQHEFWVSLEPTGYKEEKLVSRVETR